MKDLITDIIESQASQTQVIDLTGDEAAEIEEAGVPALALYSQDRSEYGLSPIPLSTIAGPIKRYVVSSFTGFTLPRHGTRD